MLCRFIFKKNKKSINISVSTKPGWLRHRRCEFVLNLMIWKYVMKEKMKMIGPPILGPTACLKRRNAQRPHLSSIWYHKKSGESDTLVYPSPLPCPFPPSMSHVSIIYALPFSTPYLLFLNLSFAFWTYIQYIYIYIKSKS